VDKRPTTKKPKQRIEPMAKFAATLTTIGLAVTGYLATYDWAPQYAIAIGLIWLTAIIFSLKGSNK
jgi:hypothetical protein